MMDFVRRWLEGKVEEVLEDQIEECVDRKLKKRFKLLRQENKKIIEEEAELIQKRLSDQLKYRFSKLTSAPDIILRDELTARIGTEYTLLEYSSKDAKPVMLGGNLNLVALQQGDVAEISCIFFDHKGTPAALSREEVRGPADSPFYIIEPLVVTSGIRITYRALQGHSRPIAYAFYKWR